MLVHQSGGWLIDRTRFSTRPAEPRHSFHPESADPLGRACSPLDSQPKETTARERKPKIEGTSVRVKGQTGEIAASRKMTYNWAWLLLLLFSLISIGICLPASLMEDAKKVDQAMKPKSKRTQETLMFGNQQNRQAANAVAAADESFTSNAEKRTLAVSGLGGLKAALAEDDKPSPALKSPSNAMYEHEPYSPYYKNYDYSKLIVNEVEEDVPRVWDTMPYSRYYAGEDRSKRSEKSITTSRPSTTTLQPPTNSFQAKRLPMPSLMLTQQPVQAQVKRSVPFYQEPRYKRELSLDINPNDMLTLLSLWENEQRNGNWRKYPNEEYEIDDSDFIDEEDARNALPWLTPVYPSRHYDTLSPSDIGIVRTHPPSYYEQYGKQLDQQYEGAAQYGNHVNPQYDFLYPQRAAYYPQKRFMVSKKRTQSYDPYSAAQLQLSSQPRSYQYPHRMVY